jgi:hypothetical protein
MPRGIRDRPTGAPPCWWCSRMRQRAGVCDLRGGPRAFGASTIGELFEIRGNLERHSLVAG